MKKYNKYTYTSFFLLVFIIISIIFFNIKYVNSSKITEDVDFAVYDMNHMTTFKIKNDQLTQINKKKWSKSGDIQFWRDSFWEMNGSFYTKTSENKKMETYLAKIDANLSVDLVKAQGNDAYTSTVDDDFFYATACFTNRTEFYKYDKNLNLILKKELKESYSVLTNQMISFDDNLYVLAGYHSSEDDIDKNVLLMLSKEFDVVEETILSDNDSSYLKMGQFEENLYISETNIGTTDMGEPQGGHRLLVYNLKTKIESYIELTYSYPMDIYIDAVNSNLIIRNYELYVPEDIWTVYSIKDKKEYFIDFSQDRLSERNHKYAPFFMQKNGLYNFLLDETIIQFDPVTKTKNTFNLSEFNLDLPHTLIVK